MLVRSIRVLCLKLAVLFILFISTSALGLASCGQDSIPYLLSVDLSGRPELYCETPVCFGKPLKQRTTVAPTTDYEEDENKEEESTMSTSLQQYRRRLKKRRFTRSVGGFAECTGELTDAICSGPDEWTGAVAEVNNGTHISLQMECCRYEGLGEAIELKTLVLRPGDRYVGGAIRENGKLAAFDLVKEVRKNVTAFNQVRYVISVYRMHCAQEPKSKDMFLEGNQEQYVHKVTQLTSRSSYTPTPSTPSMRRFHKLTRPPVDNFGHRLDHDVISRRRHPPMRNSYYRSSNFGGRMTRRQQARFPPYNRRRQFYRPIVDDYDEYYDVEPMSYRRPVYRKPKIKIADDQLWPLSYPASSTVKSNTRTHRPRQYNAGAYETEHAVSFRPEDEYQVQESQYSPAPSPPVPVPTESQLITYPQPNNYVTLLPSVGVQEYASANSYVPPPPPQPNYPVGGSAVGTNYETYQTNQQQQQQSISLAGSSDCSTPCASSSSYSSCAPTCSAPTCTPSCCCSSGGMNALFSGLQCFSGDMTVKTPTGEKRIDELEVGEMVLSIDESLISYSPIVMFLHRKRKEEAIYLKLETKRGGSLKLTDFHLIYTSKTCQPGERLKLVHARDLTVGQCVYMVSNETHGHTYLHSTQLTRITQVKQTGIYAPLTDVAAQTLQQTFFSWWRSIHFYADQFLLFFDYNSDQKSEPFNRPMDLLPPKSSLSYWKTNDGELPFGVEYLTTVMEIFVPQSVIYS